MEHYLETKDFLVSGEKFSLLLDQERALLKTDPLPEDLAPYYQSEDYLSHTDARKGLMARLYQWVKHYNNRRKIGLLNKYAQTEKTILDIGAGTGDFLLAAKKAGYRITGVEPNAFAREKALAKGIALNEEINFNQRFECITLWHVLEHMRDPDKEIARLKVLLEAHGTFFIAVPNYRSHDAQYYGEYWAAYDVPRHLWHFSMEGMEQLCSNHNLAIADIRPMPFDAFYIALLSEKYRGNKNNFIKALLVGLRSNWKAKRNGEYSALLYVIKKKP